MIAEVRQGQKCPATWVEQSGLEIEQGRETQRKSTRDKGSIGPISACFFLLWSRSAHTRTLTTDHKSVYLRSAGFTCSCDLGQDGEQSDTGCLCSGHMRRLLFV